jgi:hypothetical protein
MTNDFLPSLSQIILILNSYVFALSLSVLNNLTHEFMILLLSFCLRLIRTILFSSNPILSPFRHLIISILPFSIIFVLF